MRSPIDYILGQSPIIQDAIAVIIVVGGSHLNSPVEVPSYRTLTLRLFGIVSVYEDPSQVLYIFLGILIPAILKYDYQDQVVLAEE